MSKGYWVVRANIFDDKEYSKYIKIATKVVNDNNGIFLVRGGQQTEFEGQGFNRTVIVEFENYEKAVDCYNSKEYQLALNYVKQSADRLFTSVEGI